MSRNSPKKKRINLDASLVALLSVAFFSQILTFRKFQQYRQQVDFTMSSNLDTMRKEHSRSLEDLKSLVNSGLFKRSQSSDVVVPTNSVPVEKTVEIRPGEYRRLPSGLKLVRCGDWYVSDGVWKYGVGEVSPVGLITNICRGVVFTDLDVFSCVNSPSVRFEKGAL